MTRLGEVRLDMAQLGPVRLGREGYEDYIASPRWRRLRAKALERDGHSCRLCDSSESLEVHHRRYPPAGRWALDHVKHLTTLCADCHEAVTCRQREKRYAVISLVGSEIRRITPAVEVYREQKAEVRLSVVARIVPAAEVQRKRLQGPEVQDHRRRAGFDAQWPDRRPTEPARTEHRRNYQQAKKD